MHFTAPCSRLRSSSSPVLVHVQSHSTCSPVPCACIHTIPHPGLDRHHLQRVGISSSSSKRGRRQDAHVFAGHGAATDHGGTCRFYLLDRRTVL
eukprot:364991-Chlamydomonas_euryale.AAC.20